MTRFSLFSMAFLLAAPVGAQTVLVVDDDFTDGVDYASVTEAVTEAPDGAILLVREGFYNTSVVVDGKSLTIVAEEGNNVMFSNTGNVDVRNLAAGQTFTMVGITIDSTFGASDPLVLTNSQGTIWIEDCTLEGGAPALFAVGNAVSVSNCAAVVFQGCALSGGTGSVGMSSGSGINAFNSNVHVYGCDMTGGPGPLSTSIPLDGGDGVRLDGGLLFAAHSTFTGGVGGEGGSIFFCLDGGDGGSGIRLIGSNPVAEVYDSTFVGGGPGLPTGPGTCLPGQPGAPTTVAAGVLNQSALSTHAFDLPFPLRSGSSATLTFDGEAGESVWFLYGTDPIGLFLPGVSGSLLANVPFFLIFAGTLDVTGTLDFTIEGPEPPPAADGMVWYLQSLYLNLSSGFLLGPGGALIVVDASF